MIPDNILKLMTPPERKAYGRRGLLASEAMAINKARVEADIHKTFIQWLNLHDLLFLRARMDKKSTMTKGAADFTVIRGNRTILIECKMPGEKLKPDQEEFKLNCERNGTPLHIAYDAATAIELVRTFFRI